MMTITANPTTTVSAPIQRPPVERYAFIIVDSYELSIQRRSLAERHSRRRAHDYPMHRITTASKKRLQRLLNWDGWYKDISVERDLSVGSLILLHDPNTPKAAR
jgi:hypothetical protein